MLGAVLAMSLAAAIAVDGLRRERSGAVGAFAIAGALALAAVAARLAPGAAGRVMTAAVAAPARFA